jgi:hypothetical protein
VSLGPSPYRRRRHLPHTGSDSVSLCPRLPYTCTVLYHTQIFIKTLTGRKQALNFEPENQVLAVKQSLQEKEGIQVDQIKLIHSGKQLADDKTLESYNITAGATIHMVLQLRGGASN